MNLNKVYEQSVRTLKIIIEFPVKTKGREPLSETERVTTQFLTRLRGIHLRLHLLLIQRFCIRWIMQQASLWCRTNGLSLFNFHFERGSLDDADSRSCCQSGYTYNLVFLVQSCSYQDGLGIYTGVDYLDVFIVSLRQFELYLSLTPLSSCMLRYK